MTLAELQHAFLGLVRDDASPVPADWDARLLRGIDVYRNNYRGALLAALRATFERSCAWVGDGAFERAAAHHLISHPPHGWSIDAAGEGFAETLDALFAHEPDVGDLARLEWAMHGAFVAADAAPLDVAGFQRLTAGFGEADWVGLRLRLQPALRLFAVRTDCVSLWRALVGGERPPEPPRLTAQAHVLVWREGHRPVCRLLDADEAALLAQAGDGECYGELCARLVEHLPVERVAQRAGSLLARWLRDGLVCDAWR